jgi:5-methylcytosine-specific restriction enzyme A
MLDWLANLFTAKPQAIRSPRWRDVREAHLRTQPNCQVCGTKTGVEVHHKIPVHIDPARELELVNLITLCERNGCHFLFGHGRDWRAFNPSVVEHCFKARQMIAARKYTLSVRD